MAKIVQLLGAGNEVVWINPLNVEIVYAQASGCQVKLTSGAVFNLQANAEVVAAQLNSALD